jgi:hypothetical protein
MPAYLWPEIGHICRSYNPQPYSNQRKTSTKDDETGTLSETPQLRWLVACVRLCDAVVDPGVFCRHKCDNRFLIHNLSGDDSKPSSM